MRTPPVEAIEAAFPVVVWRKEFREGSGGAGLHRGGFGQVLEYGGLDDVPFSVAAMFDRTWQAPQGRHGGHDGAKGVVRLGSGRPLASKGRQSVPHGERLVLELPGGGGYGPPLERDPERVRADVLDGLITATEAERDYGVALTAEGLVDGPATEALRLRMAAAEGMVAQ